MHFYLRRYAIDCVKYDDINFTDVIMSKKIIQVLILSGILSLLVACSWSPFNTSAKEQSRVPANSVAYVCNDNHQFFLRMLNKGNDAWLIYPDHEVNLSKSTDNANRYVSGVITLFLNGDETTLNDGEKIAYIGCKPQIKK